MCRACRPRAAFAPVAGEFDEASTHFRGSPQDPTPAPFFGGNYHFAAAELIAAFEKAIRNWQGASTGRRPPGLLAQKIKGGGAIPLGDQAIVDEGTIEARAVPCPTDKPTDDDPEGQPGHVTGPDRSRQAPSQA